MIARTRSLWPRLVAHAVWLSAIAAPNAVIAEEADGGYNDCADALRETIRSGRPTVVVVTSRAEPASVRLREAIADDLIGGSLGRTLQFAEMPVELFDDRVERLGVDTFPTVLAYGRRGGALARLGASTSPRNAADVAVWLGSLGLLGRTSDADPAVATASFGHHRDQAVAAPSPSPQQPLMAPPAKSPPSQLVPVPQGIPFLASPPPQSYSQVVTHQAGPPVILQPQSPAIFIRPQAPRILLGETPPPEITVIQAPQGPPTVNYAVVGAAPGPALNLFQATPSPQTPGPSLATPQSQAALPIPQAPAMPYAAPVPLAAPVAGFAAVGAPEQSVVGTTAVLLLLENPDVVNALIGGLGKGFMLLGKALERHGHPRFRVDQPKPMPASGVLTAVQGIPITTQAALPLQQLSVPQAPPYVPQAPPYVPQATLYVPQAAPVPALPSPQSPSKAPVHGIGTMPRGGLFSRWNQR